jgi:hypothetical protein
VMAAAAQRVRTAAATVSGRVSQIGVSVRLARGSVA